MMPVPSTLTNFALPAMQKITRLLVGALLCFFSMFPSATFADTHKSEYGYSDLYGELTPSQVYELVKNIDALIMRYAQKHRPQRVNALPTDPIRVSNYTPEQVFVALLALSDNIDRFLQANHLPLIKRIEREQNNAIPAEVYLQAGLCLDSLIMAMSRIENGKSFGDFYALKESDKTKTPSDVYALVDLVHRKLFVLLDAGSQQQ
ncbi:hypothetical protein A1OW_11230 [Enterovibrio norvegicus]|uniref:hypothetical protein n=1 Tax=Enterovibrio norvegicus TaxID=188144 RepID=UPI0002DF9A50|nr:hypothetical protein [Enterovibrio norvegicus]OEF50259.1 hypothetical protein A1OW_11230 [Enterovibrio norvegicus]